MNKITLKEAGCIKPEVKRVDLYPGTGPHLFQSASDKRFFANVVFSPEIRKKMSDKKKEHWNKKRLQKQQSV